MCLTGGDNFQACFSNALMNSKLVVLCCSAESMDTIKEKTNKGLEGN
jgi:hypothetical protein